MQRNRTDLRISTLAIYQSNEKSGLTTQSLEQRLSDLKVVGSIPILVGVFSFLVSAAPFL